MENIFRPGSSSEPLLSGTPDYIFIRLLEVVPELTDTLLIKTNKETTSFPNPRPPVSFWIIYTALSSSSLCLSFAMSNLLQIPSSIALYLRYCSVYFQKFDFDLLKNICHVSM